MNNHIWEKVAKDNQELIANKKVYVPETIIVPYDHNTFVENPIIVNESIRTNVVFEQMKLDDCALHYIECELGKHIVIVNFLSNNFCDRKYVNENITQETNLYLCAPALYPSLSKIHYPFQQNSVLITPDIEIMRDNINYNLFPKGAMYFVDVVSVVIPFETSSTTNIQCGQFFDEECMKRTFENMYTTINRYLPKTDTLIFGISDNYCYNNVLYCNYLASLSKIMNDVNLKYGGFLKTVVFSVTD